MPLVERFQAVYSRAGVTSPPTQDVMTMGLHFMRRTTLDGSTATALDNTIRALVETRWDTFEIAYKPYRPVWAVHVEDVWSDAFPVGPRPVPAIRRVVKSSVGTGPTGLPAMAPQAAINCTLTTGNRRHWGRWALGALTYNTADEYGTVTSAARTAIANALKAFLDGCITDGAYPVVYTRPRYVHPPDDYTVVTDGVAWPVTGARVDKVFDSQRRRRYEHTQTADRTVLALAALSASPLPYTDTSGRP